MVCLTLADSAESIRVKKTKMTKLKMACRILEIVRTLGASFPETTESLQLNIHKISHEHTVEHATKGN